MRFKSVLLLAVALGCGLVAMLGVQQVISGPQEDEGVSQVLVATAEILPGMRVDETNTRFQEMPVDEVPAGAVTEPEQYRDRAARFALVPGDIVKKAKLGPKGVFGASTDIPEGMRVVTVPVDQTKTHSGLILPGDYVDVLLTFKQGRRNQALTKTKTVLEYIQVFATGNQRRADVSVDDSGEMKVKTISLLVNPEQANLLMLAESQGELTLALRRMGDDSPVKANAVTTRELQNRMAQRGKQQPVGPGMDELLKKLAAAKKKEPKPKPEPKPEPEPEPEPPQSDQWTIYVYQGDEVREELVELPGDAVTEVDPASSAQSPEKAERPDQPLKNWLQRILTGA